jgi:dUTPase
MIISHNEKAELIETDEIKMTERGTGGFGHSGKR